MTITVRSLLLAGVIFIFFAKSYGQQPIAGLLDAAYAHRLKADYESNLRLLSQAEKKLDENTPPRLVAQLYGEISKQFLINASYDSAKMYAEKSLKAGKDARHRLAEAYGYAALATWYNYLDIGALAVENVQKALHLLSNENEPALHAQLYYTLYGVYSSWDDIPLTDKYARLAINAATAAKQYERLSNAYTARSVVMEYHYKESKDAAYLDSMRQDLLRSVQLYHDHPGKVGIRTYAIANLNLADFFFKYRQPEKQSTQDSILLYASIAAQAARNFDANYEIMGNVNGLLSEIALQQGNSDLAESYLMDSYVHLLEAKRPSYYTLSNVAQALATLYEQKKEYKKALDFQRKNQAFTDSIFNKSQIQQAKKLEAQFENRQLAAHIKASELKARNRKNQNLLLSGISVLLLFSLFLMRSWFKSKAKLHTQTALQIQKEHEEAKERTQMQLKVEKEEQARLKAEQELLMIQKDQLQKEAMADALQIERKNQLLYELKEKLKKLETEENKGTVERLLREEMRVEEALEQSANEFQNINPAFFQRLKEQSDNRLTVLDLKYCAYLLLKLSTKQMAAAFHVDPKSIRVSKYRIKQKLGLDRDTDLDRFLDELK